MRIEITGIQPAFDAVQFGDAGAYEKIVGRIHGEVDPGHRLNVGIVNLDRALRNGAGMVEYSVDFCLLKPANMRRSSGRILYDVLNRGNKLVLGALNDAPGGNDPAAAADAGNGFLMRRGYVVLWSAWQGDVAAGEGRMLARMPIATDNGAPIVAVNRDEFIFNHSHNPARAPLSYPAHTMDQEQATLSVRQRERDTRVALPAAAWRYLSNKMIEITRPADFDAGAIYEFIYPARDPFVMGLGMAAIRDVVSFFHRRASDDAGQANPLSTDGGAPPIARAYAFGMSQSGRFLRDWLWQGFNEDLNGARVFDGVIPSLAGSRKTFTNFAFAQPGRFSCQHEDHLTPGDQFPFTYETRLDPVSGRTDGILARCRASNTCPKIMQTDSSGEFWQGRASLVTNEAGRDLELPEEVRVYHFAGTQHGGRMATAIFPFCQYPGNPVDINAAHRALLVALDQWVSAAVPPPPSNYPRASDGTLVPADTFKFPVPGVTYSGTLNELCEVDYTVQPPLLLKDREYVVMVPAVDRDGNELGGIRLPDIAAPLGTHTGWNPRREGFAPGDLALLGWYLPFARTAAQRPAAADPRPSLEERYGSHEAYVAAIAAAARQLCEARLLLPEDVEGYIEAARRRAKYFNDA